ncbi:MAG: hypothetical protein ACPF9D_13675, partial [Owenweeksia sp.]
VSLRKFPNASFVFNDVFSQGANSQPGDTLIFARRIYLQFSIWEVLFSSVSIKEINVEEAVVNIHIREDKKDNYRIWKEDSTSSQGLFTLEQVSLDDVRTSVTSTQSGFRSHFDVQQLTFNGNFEESDYKLENEGKLHIHEVWLDETRYLNSIPLQTAFTLQGYNDSLLVKPATVKWDDLVFDFATTTTEKQTRLKASSENMNLSTVQKLLKDQGWHSFKDAEIKGKGSASFSAVFKEGEKSQFRVDFVTDKSSIEGYKSARVKDISCSGSYVNNGNADRLEINRFEGKGKTGEVKGDLVIRDLTNPFVKLNLLSDLELAEWLVLFPIDTVENAKGKAIIDLHFENQFGSLKEMKASELRKARTEGSLKIEGASFQFLKSDKTVNNINGELAFLGNNLEVKRLYFKTGESDIYLEGRFGNVL